MTDSSNAWDGGRIEGKLDVVIEQLSKTHDDIRHLAQRQEAQEATKADKETVDRLAKKVNEVESFKSRLIGGAVVISVAIGSVITWAINKTNGV